MYSQKSYPEDYSCIIEPQGHRGGIFIGNLQAAQNMRTLKKHSIKAVLTAAKGINLNHPKSDIPLFLHVEANDHESFELKPYFHRAADFIAQALVNTNIMVHCLAGVSRSVSLVIAFLIKHKNMAYNDAYNLVKNKRRIIHPNDGFINQLKQFDLQLRRGQEKRSLSPKHYHLSASPQRLNFMSTSKSDLRRERISTSPKREHYLNKEENRWRQMIYNRFSSQNIAKNPEGSQHRCSVYESPLKMERNQDNAGRIKRISSAFDSNPKQNLYTSYKETIFDPLSNIKNTQFSINTTDIDRKIQDIRRKYQQYTGTSVNNAVYSRYGLSDENNNKRSDYKKQMIKGEEWKRRNYNYLGQYDQYLGKPDFISINKKISKEQY